MFRKDVCVEVEGAGGTWRSDAAHKEHATLAACLASAEPTYAISNAGQSFEDACQVMTSPEDEKERTKYLSNALMISQ